MSPIERRFDDRFGRLAEFLVRHRFAVLAVTLVATAALAVSASRLTVNTSTEYMFREGDEQLVRYDDFKERFGSDEFVFVLLDSEQIFTPTELERVVALQEAIEAEVPYVTEVTSIVDVDHIESTFDGIEVRPLIGRDAIPEDPAAAAALRDRAFSRPEYTEIFVTPDGTHAGLLVEVQKPDGVVDYRTTLATELRDLTARPEHASFEAKIVGPSILDADMQATMIGEFKTFAVISTALIIAILAWLFRRPVEVASAVLVVVFTNVWMLGLMALAGIPLTMLSIVLPALLIVVGTADSIHVMTEYRRQAEKHGDAGPGHGRGPSAGPGCPSSSPPSRPWSGSGRSSRWTCDPVARWASRRRPAWRWPSASRWRCCPRS